MSFFFKTNPGIFKHQNNIKSSSHYDPITISHLDRWLRWVLCSTKIQRKIFPPVNEVLCHQRFKNIIDVQNCWYKSTFTLWTWCALISSCSIMFHWFRNSGPCSLELEKNRKQLFEFNRVSSFQPSTTCLCCPFCAVKAAPKRTMDTEASPNRDWTNPKGGRWRALKDFGIDGRQAKEFHNWPGFPNDLYILYGGWWWMGGWMMCGWWCFWTVFEFMNLLEDGSTWQACFQWFQVWIN